MLLLLGETMKRARDGWLERLASGRRRAPPLPQNNPTETLPHFCSKKHNNNTRQSDVTGVRGPVTDVYIGRYGAVPHPS